MLDEPHDERLLTQAEIARLAGVARPTVTYWRKTAGFPPAQRAGATELFRMDEVLRCLDVRPVRSPQAPERAGTTYGDRMRSALRAAEAVTAIDSTPQPEPWPALRGDARAWHGTSSERDAKRDVRRDESRVRELMDERTERLMGADSVIDHMTLLLCLLFLRTRYPACWRRLAEAAGSGSGSDGSRALLRLVGEMADQQLRRLGTVPGMQDQLMRLEPRTHADLEDVVRRIGELGQQAFRLVLGEYEGRARLRSGEFFTPNAVARIMVAIASEERAPGPLGTVFDPYTRGGELLAAAVDHGDVSSGTRVFGYSHAQNIARLASMNLALLGVRSSVLYSRRRPWAERRDQVTSACSLVLTNPPFNMRDPTSQARADGDWPFGPPPVGNDNYAYLQYALSCLEDGGIAAVVMPNKAGDSANRAEQIIRENLVEQGVVRGVVELPDKLFSRTSVPVSLWFLCSPADGREETVFVDARDAGVTDNGRRVLRDEDVEKVVGAYRAARRAGLQDPAAGDRAERDLPAAVITRELVARSGCSLRPTTHLGTGRQQPRATAESVTAAWDKAEQARMTVRQVDADVRAAGLGATAFVPATTQQDVELGDLCEVAAGPSPARLKAEAPGPEQAVPVIYPQDLRNGRIALTSARGLSREAARRLHRFELKEGDILCIRTGAMKAPALVRPQEAGLLLSSHLFRLRVKEKAMERYGVDPAYLAAYLGTPDALAWVIDRSSATGQRTISTAVLRTQPVPLPPYAEQRRIAAALSLLEAQAAAHRRYADAVTESRAAMADLLTSSTRVR